VRGEGGGERKIKVECLEGTICASFGASSASLGPTRFALDVVRIEWRGREGSNKKSVKKHCSSGR